MRHWAQPGEDLHEWAQQLTQQLVEQDQENQRSPNVGQIGEFVSLPTGWLEADGSTFDAASYPALHRLLGGTTLPNLSPVYDPSFRVGIKA